MKSEAELHWVEIEESARGEIEQRWGRLPEGIYPLSSTERPSFLPEEYWRKNRRAALAIRGKPSSDRTYCGIVLERADHGDVDQDSVGVVIHSTGPYMRAAQLLHGNWEGRTRDLALWAENTAIPLADTSHPLLDRHRPWEEFEDTNIVDAVDAVHERASSASTQWGKF